MKSALTAAFYFLFPILAFSQPIQISNLRCEYKANPLGIQSMHPRLKWEISSDGKNILQTAYRIIVSDRREDLERGIGNLWDSRKISSDASIQVPYAGTPLLSAKIYYWKVMVWDNQGDSAWSDPANWQMGLLQKADWKGAHWIGYRSMPAEDRILPATTGVTHRLATDTLPLMRKDFNLAGQVKRATIFISGLGQFALYLNGNKVGKDFLTPSWTQYEKEASYMTYDVTSELQQGKNAVGVMLGNGFYFIPAKAKRYRKLLVQYGYPIMICRIKIEYTDGSSQDIVSNESWKATPGPITFSSIYGGEDYNANLEIPGWNSPGYNASGWENAVLTDGPGKLRAQIEDPIRILDKFSPKRIYRTGPNTWVYDLGQNASGIPRITVRGSKGDSVKITPAEIVDAEGRISQRASGSPSFFTYILKGVGTEHWQPLFSYYGFRYLQVTGAVPKGESDPSNLPVIESLQGLHTRNAAGVAGTFSCSDTLFNRIFKLINWSIKSNMVSLFTDCPHREKLGWLEEAHLMGSSIHYNFDIANLNRRTILNMEDAQAPDGLVPDIAPEYVKFSGGFRDSPEWGSSSVLLPWYTYQWYGDTGMLKQAYPMMKRYIDYLGKKADNHILAYGLGDWFDIGPKRPGVSQLTPLGVTATAIYYYDLTIFTHIARLLHHTGDAAQYAKLAKRVRKAFNKKYFNKQTHQYATGSQTSNAMAVYMGLVHPKDSAAVIDNIVDNLRSSGYQLSAGDVGYRYLLQVLELSDRPDVIYAMNNRTDVPGYGYQLARGATALTESWQALPSVSNNHLMLGHLMEWFYSGLAGIRQQKGSVAYHHIEIAPQPVGDIDSCRARFHCPYGTISSQWKRSGAAFALKVHIPANTTARILIPASRAQRIIEGGSVVSGRPGSGYDRGKFWINVGSGDYTFQTLAP